MWNIIRCYSSWQVEDAVLPGGTGGSLLGPHLPPLLPPLLPPHHSAHHLCCRSHTLQVCIKNLDTIYSDPFLLSYLLSSLPITVITTCAAALILFRSVLRTYIRSTRAPPSLSPTSSPPSPSHDHHLCCRSHTIQVCLR
jgi:hypothetical protein